MEQISIEFGASDQIKEGEDFATSITRSIEIGKKLGITNGFDVQMIPYDGVSETVLGSYLRSRKSVVPSMDMVTSAVRAANQLGSPYKVALNQGISHEGELDLFDTRYKEDLRVLDMLAEESARSGITNIVVVCRDEVLRLIRGYFPGIHVSASAIRYAAPGTPNQHIRKYTEDLKKFDSVVPIPQHTNPAILGPNQKNASKFIVFPFLTCGQTNLEICQKHYRAVDAQGWNPSPFRDDFLCTNGSSLFERHSDFRELVAMGVDSFKISRAEGTILKEGVSKILGRFQRAKRQIKNPRITHMMEFLKKTI